jgi:hypothetical protein
VSTPLADALPSPTAASERGQDAPSSATAGPPRTPSFREWLREPLLHFVLLGGALFALDHVLASKADDPHTIVVTQEIERETLGTFKAIRGREPNAEELEALHRVWLDNEVLYREGLSLAVDKGDPAIRERVIFKALSVVDSGVKLPDVDDNTLRAWFEARRDKYDDPARYDFEEAALAGELSEARVRELVAKLASGASGDAGAGLRVFKARPRQNVIESYGADFERALQTAKPNEWQAFRTKDGFRAMRVTGITGAKPANFEQLRGVILHDWKDAVASEQRSAAVHALAKKYTVEFEPAAKNGAPAAVSAKPAKDGEQ